jgi:hypothetical protein
MININLDKGMISFIQDAMFALHSITDDFKYDSIQRGAANEIPLPVSNSIDIGVGVVSLSLPIDSRTLKVNSENISITQNQYLKCVLPYLSVFVL